MPTALKDLDDKVLGRRTRRRADDAEPYPGDGATRVVERPARRHDTGAGARQVLRTVLRVSAAVLLLLAAALALAVLFLLLPTNADNALVSGTLDLAGQVAGPFRDVFTADDAETEQVVNDAFAAGVYLVGAAVLNRLAGRVRP